MLDLLPFATPRQREVVEALQQHGTKEATARALGIDHRAVYRIIKRLRVAAAKQGYSPEHDMTHAVPDGFKVKGVSTYYNSKGQPTGQWVKSSEDADRREQMLQEAAQALSSELPRLPIIKKPARVEHDLCNVYTLTDCHVGAMAWEAEGGADWDLEIAEATLTNAFLAMLKSSPDARIGIVAQLGDWLHFDGLLPVTPTHGHILDASGRFSQVVQSSIRIIRRIVDAALTKHHEVKLLIAEGNHDLSSAVWMRHLFSALYEKNKRIEIIASETPFYAYQHGKTMLAWHHGHKKSNESLPLLMATQYSSMWGATAKRYCHTGHRHHVEIKEHSGMTVTQHSTLAARDSHASHGGWHSERQTRAITYHAEYGEVAQIVVTPEMLK